TITPDPRLRSFPWGVLGRREGSSRKNLLKKGSSKGKGEGLSSPEAWRVVAIFTTAGVTFLETSAKSCPDRGSGATALFSAGALRACPIGKRPSPAVAARPASKPMSITKIGRKLFRKAFILNNLLAG